MSLNGWIGVDFDGTLAKYDNWIAAHHCGEPVLDMLFRVKKWLAEGREVRIFTARIHPLDACVRPDDALLEHVQRAHERVHHRELPRVQQALDAVVAIQEWCRQHLGQVLPITNVKDYAMIELWDDRAVQVRPNTGEVVGHSTRGLS